MEPQMSHTQQNVAIGNQTAPVVSFKDWMITILLMAIPIVNIVMLFVWAFGGNTNPSKANYAKAALIWVVIGIVLNVIIFVFFLSSMLSEMFSYY
ncbi:hypothetical protein [Paenibacillus sp. GCM10012303]|jgi:uncharacterized membrane protein YdbT with pleckstrin-like domain|uniref:hypothetical protein n=1 Tax=Paenibacillus sp. GCM10012303 TaxID=3317340 RepID=UPI00360FB34A